MNRIRRALIGTGMLHAFLGVVLFLQEAHSLEWKDPMLAKDERAVYRTMLKGIDLGLKKEIRVVVREKVYEITFSLIDKEQSTSSFTSTFTRGSDLKALHYARKKIDASGESIIEEKIRLADNPNYSGDTCPFFGNFLVFRSLFKNPGHARLKYPCLFPGGTVFVLLLKTSQAGTILTPAGSFDCLRIDETLEVNSVIKGTLGSIMSVLPVHIVPRTSYWISRDHPHVLVRREGVAGPPPHDYLVTDELLRYE